VGRVGPSRWIVSEDEGASGAVLFGPRDRVSNKGELCAKERQVVFPGGRSVLSRVPVRCCWKSGAITSDRREERRSERSCVEGLRSGTSGRNQTEELKEGEACGGFPHPSLSQSDLVHLEWGWTNLGQVVG
jgi:hypothetical protein